MTKSDLIKQIEWAIESLLENGAKDRQTIYSTVYASLGVPRPIVVRVARKVRQKLEKRLKVLESGYGWN